MREELLQERKKAIYGLICDELYVPMKAKEIAAVLNVPKSDRRDLAEVLDALVAEGKVSVIERQVHEVGRKIPDRRFCRASERIWLCDGRGGE